VCSRSSDKPICTAVPAWAFSTGKRCAPFRKRVCTTALLPTCSSAPARNGPRGLAHVIRGVYAMPVVVAGEYVGALDFFQADPTVLDSKQVAGVVLAAELAQIPMLDLLHQDLYDAAATPGSDAWTELNTLTRAEVSQATGMLIAQLNIAAPAALVRLRAHAYATNRSATDVARDIIDRRLRLEPD
jgi:hypothetical protein